PPAGVAVSARRAGGLRLADRDPRLPPARPQVRRHPASGAGRRRRGRGCDARGSGAPSRRSARRLDLRRPGALLSAAARPRLAAPAAAAGLAALAGAPGPTRDSLVLAAATILQSFGRFASPGAAADAARRALDTGTARARFARGSL